MATRWDRPDFWWSEIARSRNKREHVASVFEWKKIADLLESGAIDVSIDAESDRQNSEDEGQSAFVNWVWAFVQTFIPAIYWKQPHISVAPKRSMYQAGAAYIEPLINALVRETRLRDNLRKVMLDCLVYGLGFLKIGWYTRIGQVPNGATEIKTTGKKTTIDTDIQFRVDHAYAVRVSPTMLYLDPEAPSYEELTWIAQESYVPYDAIKSDPYLKHTETVSPLIMGQEDLSAFMPSGIGSEWEMKENRWCRMIEIWDRERDRVMVMVQGSTKFNREVAWPYPDMYGFPFRMLTVTDSLNDIYPPSVIVPWLSLVQEHSLIRSIRLRHLQKMSTKALIPPNVMTEDQVRDLQDATQDIILCQGDPQSIVPFTTVKPDANLYAGEDSVKSDLREISGYSELLSGSVPFSRIAATTSAIMEQNSNLRFRFYSERLGEYIIDTAQELFKISRLYQRYPIEVQITGGPRPEWLEVSAENLAGEYWFKCDIEEMSVATKQQRIKEAFDALSALSQFPQTVKIDALVRDFLIAKGVSNLQEYMIPPQGPPLDPNYENQLIAGGVPVEPTPAEDFALHLQIHGQFIESPQYGQLVTKNPAIAGIMSEHIQKTNYLAQQSAAMQAPQGAGAAGAVGSPGVTPTASMQSGQALAGSQPPVRPGNDGRGGGLAALMQAMTRAGRG